MIAETAPEGDAISRQGSTESMKKSLLKSTSSIDKSSEKRLDIKVTEHRSPSPIPEDPVGEEASKQSTSSAITDQKKIDEGDESKQENVQEQQRKRSEDTSKNGKLEEQTNEERVEDKDKSQQSENTQGNNSDNVEAEISELQKENDEGKSKTEEIPESVPIQTTKLRGKSKATGRIMGGWI